MNIRQYYPCKKLIDWLLLEHRKSVWRVNQKITYKKFLPHSKKFINNWINENLFGPTKLMQIETLKSISTPKTLESKFKIFHSDIWIILYDRNFREQVELDSIFGYSPKEIHVRLNGKIKPRIINVKAIEQFLYFFWNLGDDNEAFRPEILLKIIESDRGLSREYGHILKYSNDKRGREKYENNYNLYNPEKPNFKNIIKVIDHTTFNQMDALDENNIDKLETHTNIQVKNCIVLKTLKTIPNNSGKKDFSDILDLEDEKIEK